MGKFISLRKWTFFQKIQFRFWFLCKSKRCKHSMEFTSSEILSCNNSVSNFYFFPQSWVTISVLFLTFLDTHYCWIAKNWTFSRDSFSMIIFSIFALKNLKTFFFFSFSWIFRPFSSVKIAIKKSKFLTFQLVLGLILDFDKSFNISFESRFSIVTRIFSDSWPDSGNYLFTFPLQSVNWKLGSLLLGV